MNAFTVDLEDWFCVRNLRDAIPFDQWNAQEQRVVASTTRLLDLLDRHKVSATFFVLGWTAARFPELIRDVAARGHEIACHSHCHQMVSELTPEQFAEDLSEALATLRALTDQPVEGFRAPSFSITRAQSWVWPIMRANGITYDSSIFPFGGHPDYGIADAPLEQHVVAEGITEFPMACAEIGSHRVPTGGGGYFRLLPYVVTRNLMRRCNAAGRPVSFYIHPWELDPGQPRVATGSRVKQLRHYANLGRTEQRLERLLEDFAFTTMRDLLAASPERKI
ncbi:MAG: DUF3473 domain-containing protein [Thermoleophilia bacterium]|nr:DUF3473 domain-containing protein [Thermoleophilia bacterium]